MSRDGRSRPDSVRHGASASGETDKEAKLEDVGFLITYRHDLCQERIFLETFGGTAGAGGSW